MIRAVKTEIKTKTASEKSSRQVHLPHLVIQVAPSPLLLETKGLCVDKSPQLLLPPPIMSKQIPLSTQYIKAPFDCIACCQRYSSLPSVSEIPMSQHMKSSCSVLDARPAVISPESRVHLPLTKAFPTVLTSVSSSVLLHVVVKSLWPIYKSSLSCLSVYRKVLCAVNFWLGKKKKCVSLVYAAWRRLHSGSSLPGRGPEEQAVQVSDYFCSL